MGQDNFGQGDGHCELLEEGTRVGAAPEQVEPDELAADDTLAPVAGPDGPEIGAVPRIFDPSAFSSLVVRTIDGLRVAVAGLPADMPVEIEGVVLDAMSVGELRALNSLRDRLRIIIPYRLLPDSRVHVQGAEEGERGL